MKFTFSNYLLLKTKDDLFYKLCCLLLPMDMYNASLMVNGF
jgi:hypothetical protein